MFIIFLFILHSIKELQRFFCEKMMVLAKCRTYIIEKQMALRFSCSQFLTIFFLSSPMPQMSFSAYSLICTFKNMIFSNDNHCFAQPVLTMELYKVYTTSRKKKNNLADAEACLCYFSFGTIDL